LTEKNDIRHNETCDIGEPLQHRGRRGGQKKKKSGQRTNDAKTQRDRSGGKIGIEIISGKRGRKEGKKEGSRVEQSAWRLIPSRPKRKGENTSKNNTVIPVRKGKNGGPDGNKRG